MERLFVVGRPLLGFNSLFSLIILNPEGNICGTRKGIKFCIERLSINSAEELIFFFFFGGGSVSIGEGNGTPLQYSCLENPMDGGAW